MKLEYADEWKCEHSMQIVHYSAPYDRNVVICPNCRKYSIIRLERFQHRALNWINGFASMGPVLGSVSTAAVAVLVLLLR